MKDPLLNISLLLILGGFLCSSTLHAAPCYNHQLGLSYGQGKPNNLSGYRLNYRNLLIHNDHIKIFGDLSYARWRTDVASADKIYITAIAPVLRITIPFSDPVQFFLEGSIGPARKSTKQIGEKCSGSKWTFQDAIGLGFKFFHRFDVRIQYLHYSNGGISPPNPGIDLEPLITLSYYL